jgi:hypothetical protein
MTAIANSGLPLPWSQKSWIEVGDYSTEGWQTAATAKARAFDCCRQLERGDILYFGATPFALPSGDCAYLIGHQQDDSRLHKNISYRLQEDLLRGSSGSKEQRQHMQRIMREYSSRVIDFVTRFLTPYAGKLLCDYASFRPLEEEGRDLPLHKRNDLLHVDAFPSRPTRGGRILRVFTNIHPFRNRIWKVDGPFSYVAERYAADAGLHDIKRPGLRRQVTNWLYSAGLPLTKRSPYDTFMLHFHDFLKENSDYQTTLNARTIEFPPLSTWMVLSDGVPHAVLSGQYALEQTFIIPMEAQVSPQNSPLRILEKIAGSPLA